MWFSPTLYTFSNHKINKFGATTTITQFKIDLFFRQDGERERERERERETDRQTDRLDGHVRARQTSNIVKVTDRWRKMQRDRREGEDRHKLSAE